MLAEPTRRELLTRLQRGPLTVTELQAEVGISQPLVSKHLRVLRDQGLVQAVPEAQRRRYELRPDGFRQADEWLSGFRKLWTSRLDNLDDLLREEQDDE